MCNAGASFLQREITETITKWDLFGFVTQNFNNFFALNCYHNSDWVYYEVNDTAVKMSSSFCVVKQ